MIVGDKFLIPTPQSGSCNRSCKEQGFLRNAEQHLNGKGGRGSHEGFLSAAVSKWRWNKASVTTELEYMTQSYQSLPMSQKQMVSLIYMVENKTPSNIRWLYPVTTQIDVTFRWICLKRKLWRRKRRNLGEFRDLGRTERSAKNVFDRILGTSGLD